MRGFHKRLNSDEVGLPAAAPVTSAATTRDRKARWEAGYALHVQVLRACLQGAFHLLHCGDVIEMNISTELKKMGPYITHSKLGPSPRRCAQTH